MRERARESERGERERAQEIVNEGRARVRGSQKKRERKVEGERDKQRKRERENAYVCERERVKVCGWETEIAEEKKREGERFRVPTWVCQCLCER